MDQLLSLLASVQNLFQLELKMFGRPREWGERKPVDLHMHDRQQLITQSLC